MHYSMYLCLTLATLPCRDVSNRNRNVRCLVEIEMSGRQSFRFSRNPRRQG